MSPYYHARLLNGTISKYFFSEFNFYTSQIKNAQNQALNNGSPKEKTAIYGTFVKHIAKYLEIQKCKYYY